LSAKIATMRVLLAEDDVHLRGVLERGLREEGYVVDAVALGKRRSTTCACTSTACAS